MTVDTLDVVAAREKTNLNIKNQFWVLNIFFPFIILSFTKTFSYRVSFFFFSNHRIYREIPKFWKNDFTNERATWEYCILLVGYFMLFWIIDFFVLIIKKKIIGELNFNFNLGDIQALIAQINKLPSFVRFH